jgi:hypothetical protein
MKGLRFYNPVVSGNLDHAKTVFYSRRHSGPFYVWRDDQESSTWHPSRIDTSLAVSQSFSSATLKSLPHSLRARLGEHYLE